MREQSGSRALTAHGTLYKALGRLEERGLLTSAWGARRRGRGPPAPAALRADRRGSACGTRRSGRRPSSARRLGARVTPERMTRLVAAWVRFYTRRQPPAVAQRRSEEIDDDLHDHSPTSAQADTGDGDRAQHRGPDRARDGGRRLRPPPARPRRARARDRPARPLIAAAPWSPADFVAAGVLVAGTGLLLGGRAEAAQPRLPGRVDAAASPRPVGNADDTPGLVLFGCLLIAGTIALAVRIYSVDLGGDGEDRPAEDVAERS